MSSRLRIASLIFMMINAVVFGVGLVTVLLVPALSSHAFAWIPTVVVASFAVSAPLAWLIAPRLQMRYWRSRERDALSAGR
jgi:uncharacterized membrane protein